MRNQQDSFLYWNSPMQHRIAIIICTACIGLIYMLLHGRYILHHVDDAWFMTRVYHYIMTGVNQDTVFKAAEVTDRTQIFYIFFHNVYGRFLDFFGWTKSNAYLLCTFFVAMSAGLWYFILRKMKYTHELALLMALTMMLFPVYFKAANHARPEAMAFFLGSLAFYFFLRRNYYLSGLLIMVAFETHLMACTLGIYMVAQVFANWKEYYDDKKEFFRMIGWFVVGIITGCLYFYWLHQDVLTAERVTDLLFSHRKMGKGGGFKHIFTSYFVQSRWYLHVWEFFMILISLALYLKFKLYKKSPFIGILLVLLVLSTIILSRPNRNYMIYFFPAFQLMAFYTFEQLQKQKIFAWVLALLFLLQYGWVYSSHRSFHLNMVMSKTEENIPDKDLTVVGIPDNWFPAREHNFLPIYGPFEEFPVQELQTFYLIENDYKFSSSLSLGLESWLTEKGIVKVPILGKRKRYYMEHIDYFKTNCSCTELSRFQAFKNVDVVISKCTR